MKAGITKVGVGEKLRIPVLTNDLLFFYFFFCFKKCLKKQYFVKKKKKKKNGQGVFFWNISWVYPSFFLYALNRFSNGESETDLEVVDEDAHGTSKAPLSILIGNETT